MTGRHVGSVDRVPATGRRSPVLRSWGISARSAAVSATVVLVALAVAGIGLTAMLDRYLLSVVDDDAAARLDDIVTSLRTEPLDTLDPDQLATDQRIVAVQVISADGTVVQRSTDAPTTPLLPLSRVGPTPVFGVPGNTSADDDLRITASSVETAAGHYTVLVAGSSESVESTVKTVASLLCLSAPIVTAVVALATYLLVKRSLRSVDAIRSRVAEISTSDLAERVPVPQRHDEISALAKTMNEMLERLEAGQTAHRRFVGDASHELRSPLATIISALDVASAHPELLDEELATTTLIPEVNRMRALVEDLLLLARADERGLTLSRDDVHLDDLATSEVARLRRATTLEIGADISATQVVGDETALARMVRNLTDNAAQYARSRIVIGLHRIGNRAVLTVTDDGPGIDVADRDRVFDRFVRLDPGRARSLGGTGLGLAIVAEIVDAHHGTVDIGQSASGGAKVTVQLPLAPTVDSSR